MRTRTMARRPTISLGIGAVIALACSLAGCGTARTAIGLRPQAPPPLDHRIQGGPGERGLRVDAQVVWYPPRSKAEHIDPRRYKAVIVIRPGLKPNSLPRTRTFTAPAVVAKLAAVFNALPAEPDVTINCPEMGPSTTYQVVFVPAKRQWPRITAETSGCSMDTISVNGHQQPTLHDVGSLVAEVSRLFGGGHRT